MSRPPLTGISPAVLPGLSAFVGTTLLSFWLAAPARADGLILNEYNAVADFNWLNGGDEFSDINGGLAGDSTFGRILGNGGEWFELVVTETGLDLGGWKFVLSEGGGVRNTLTLSQDPIWTTLRAGTIITVSEQYPDDVSYDPDSGDWNINVQAQGGASGTYISANSFSVSQANWQIEILDSQDVTQYGPSGEGVSPTGVNGLEIARLEEDPSTFITPVSLCYDDGDTRSTWGLPNEWSPVTKTQNFAPLRNGTAPTTQCDGTDLTPLGFDPERLLEVEITMDPEDYETLRRQDRRVLDTLGGACGLAPPPSPYTFFPATVTVDGSVLTGVGVRKKGFFGSPDRIKPSFKIDFGEFGGTQEVYGLERMTLNNGRQDPSLMDQCLGYGLHRAAGLVASRCNFAHVSVNGVSKGIYMNVESIKDPFLVHNFGNAAGNLYEGTTADFRQYWIGLIEKKNNMDGSELLAVQAALEITDDADFLEALGAVVDIDKFITYWALGGLIGDWDGYAGNANNYWLYNNPTTGLLEFIPWSLDDIFGRDNPLRNPGGPIGEARVVFETAALSNRLWQIPSMKTAYEAEINNLIATVWDETELIAQIDRYEALIKPIAGDDLSGPIAATKDFINGRAAKVATDFALGPPAFASTLPEKLCLQPAGSLSGFFNTTYSDPLLPVLHPGSSFFVVSFELSCNTVLSVFDVGFGYDELAGPSKLTLRPIGQGVDLFNAYVFNVVVDAEEIVDEIDPVVIDVGDHIASFMLNLNLGTGQLFPIGMVTDTTLVIGNADLTPGGTVTGFLSSSLALFVPHPDFPDEDADGITDP
ncbi:MAG: CotH kinase family protein, partial [Myxococcota bacterium]